MLVLITYDVNTEDAAGRKRLRQIARQCVNYGQRVQNSVFECLLDTAQCRSLQNTLCKIMDPQRDSLRFYYLGKQYEKKIEQLPPQMVNGKPVPQGTVNNYQFVSAEGQWKISLTKGFIALSTYGYTRWEEFAQRLDRILAVFIETYHPSWFTRVGLRYVNAFRREALGLDGMLWKELITPGFLGLMGEEDAQETAFLKHELSATFQVPGGAKANVKSGPGLLRKVNNRTRETTEEKVFMLDLGLFMDSKIELGQAVPALNIVHENAGSLFRAALTDTLSDAMEPQKA